MEKIYKKLIKIIDKSRVLKNESLKDHTWFKIGGDAKILIKVKTINEITRSIDLIKKNNIDYYILGNGTNILIPDEGIDGIIIKLSKDFNQYRIEGNKVYAQAGILLSKLSKKIAKKSLTGFEFASGIPGTVGGAIFMNAGAYGGEMKDIVKYVNVLDNKGNILKLYNKDLNFGYRQSIVKEKDYIVLSVCFKLNFGDKNEIYKKIKELDRKRILKQPINMPSAGSTFKRPPGHYAGKLIDDSGLRGFRYKDAQVSQKHCGFVVNRGNATCKDVLTLINMVKKIVRDKYDVNLEREVRILGRD
ncbi:MAG: UDP-N-acetylmuramate dehydrogenase [Bacillota bacterium]